MMETTKIKKITEWFCTKYKAINQVTRQTETTAQQANKKRMQSIKLWQKQNQLHAVHF